MTQQLNPILKNDLSNGVIRNVGGDKQPENSTPFAVNFIFDENIGEATLRKGTAMIGNQIINDKSVLGLVNFRRRADTNHALLAVLSDGTNSDIYEVTTQEKSLQDDTKDLKTRFVQFLDSILRLNGTDGAKSFNGTSWVTSGGVFDLSNLPLSKYGMNYKDRVNVIGDNGILYSSSVPRWFLAYDGQSANFNIGARLTGETSRATGLIYADTDGGTTGTLQIIGVMGTFIDGEAITDDGDTPGAAVSNANSVNGYQISWTDGYTTTPIDPDNGVKGKSSGLGVVGGLMFIFFERAFYIWNGSSTNPDPIANIGCSSHESIANSDSYMFFANKDGVYMTQGGFPQLISRFMQDFFDNMLSANYSKIAGGCDGKHYYCSIGDVEIDGITISNCVLRYSIKSQEWAVYSMPTQPLVFSQYIDGNDIKLVYGDDDGNIIQINSSDTQDNYASSTATIDYEIHLSDITAPSKGFNKVLSDLIYVYTKQSSGAKLYYRADKNDNRQEDWLELAEIKENIQKIPVSTINYKKLKFKIAGVSTKGRLVFEGLECPKNTYNSL